MKKIFFYLDLIRGEFDSRRWSLAEVWEGKLSRGSIEYKLGRLQEAFFPLLGRPWEDD